MTERGPVDLSRIATIDIGAAAVFGDIPEREVTAVTSSRLDGQQALDRAADHPHQSGDGGWLSRTASQLWHEIWRGTYEQRERLWALSAHAAAGVPGELSEDIRRKAMEAGQRRMRESIEAERAADTSTGIRRVWHDAKRNVRAKWQEIRGGFTDTHRAALDVLGMWRTELDRLSRPDTPPDERTRIAMENPLYGQWLATLSSEDNLATNIAAGLVRTERGEIQIGPKLVLPAGSETGTAVLTRVVKPYLRALETGENADAVWLSGQGVMADVFRSPEFAAYLNTLTEPERDLLTSDRYATNLRSTLDGLYRDASGMMDFSRSVDALRADLVLTLGAAESGPRGKIRPAFTERLVKKNRELYDLMRRRQAINWFDDDTVRSAVERQQLVAAAATDILSYEVTLGLATALILYLPRWGAVRVARVFAPVVGGAIVAGTAAGVREWYRLGSERKRTELEAAMGYGFPATRFDPHRPVLNSVGPTEVWRQDSRRGQLMEFSDQVILGVRNVELTDAIEHLQATADVPKRLFMLTIDSDARVRLSDRHDVNLLAATPGSQVGTFDAEARTHDRLRAIARLRLADWYRDNAEFRAWVEGIAAPGTGIDAALDAVRTAQEDALWFGGGGRFADLLKTVSVDPERSRTSRDRAFNAWRLGRSAGRAAQMAVAGGVAGFLFQEAEADIINHRLWTGEIGRLLHLTPEPVGDGYPAGTAAQFAVDTTHAVRPPVTMHIDAAGNLVTADPDHGGASTLVVTDIRHHLQTAPNGGLILDDAAKAEAVNHGYTLSTGQTETLRTGLFSGTTHKIDINGTEYVVPSEVQVVPHGNGTADIVLQYPTVRGVTPEAIPIATGLHTDAAGTITDAAASGLHAVPQLTEVPAHPITVAGHVTDPIPGAAGVADANAVTHTPTVTLPEATHLVATGAHQYDLVTTAGGSQQTLLHGMTIDDRGTILNQTDFDRQLSDLNAAGDSLHLAHQATAETVTTAVPHDVTRTVTETVPLPSTVTVSAPVAAGSVDWHTSDWIGLHGGLWEKLQDTPGVGSVSHSDAAVNAVKNLWRAYEENVVHYANVDVGGHLNAAGQLPHNPQAPQLIWYNALPGNVTFHDLPDSLFSVQAMQTIAHRTSELAAMPAGSGNSLTGVDRVLWEAGVWGNETAIHGLTPDKLTQVMAWTGGGAQHVTHALAAETPQTHLVHSTEITLTPMSVVSHQFTLTEVPPPAFTGNPAAAITTTALSAREILPPLVEPPVPFIPIPLRRTPLETSTNTSVNPVWQPPPPPPPPPEVLFSAAGIYPSGALTGWKEYGDWLKRIGMFPPQVPPETARSVPREQARIAQYLTSQPEPERRTVARYADSLSTMDPAARLAIVIPAYREETGIYHTLGEWAGQTDMDGNPLDRHRYEITVVVNREHSQPDDATAAEVARFMADQPDVRVNLISVVFPDGYGGTGAARKLGTDVTLLRSLRRGAAQTAPLYIESEDADLLEIDQRTAARVIARFDQTPRYDALRGKQDLGPLILKEHDLLFFQTRGDRIVELLLRHPNLRPEVNSRADSRWNTVVTGGWDTAFTAESYALIGGYQPVRIGEDIDIGTRLSLLRGQRDRRGRVIPNTRVIGVVPNVGQSNPRRFIHALQTGTEAYLQPDPRSVDEAIRMVDPAATLKTIPRGRRITPRNKQLFEDAVNADLTWLRSVVRDRRLRRELSDRYLRLMGFGTYREVTGTDGQLCRVGGPPDAPALEGWKPDYHELPDGTIVIDNTENVAAGLKDYRRQTKGQTYRTLAPQPPRRTATPPGQPSPGQPPPPPGQPPPGGTGPGRTVPPPPEGIEPDIPAHPPVPGGPEDPTKAIGLKEGPSMG
jgi:hypothetical protein